MHKIFARGKNEEVSGIWARPSIIAQPKDPNTSFTDALDFLHLSLHSHTQYNLYHQIILQIEVKLTYI